MKYFIKLTAIVLFTFVVSKINAQEKSTVNFGKVVPADFDVSRLNVDTSKGAVIIYDAGESSFEGNTKSSFTLVFKRRTRILITSKIGFDVANVRIPLYISGNSDQDQEKLEKLKASTYNLEGGKVVETKLKSDDVFKEKYNKNHIIKKFTLPSVKEGSIIELSYTISSDYLFNLQPWSFQGAYPVVWSEYQAHIPDFLEYAILPQGQVLFELNEHPVHKASYEVMFRNDTKLAPGQMGIPGQNTVSTKLDALVTGHRWAMKNIPALIEERYTTTINNHVARMEFQLGGIRFPGEPYRNIMGNWKTLDDKLLDHEDFGLALKNSNRWLGDEIKNIVAGTPGNLEKAKRIYAFVRDNFTCTDPWDLYLNSPLKTIFTNRKGSVSDINLLLVAMLRYENIYAQPVILSTRERGLINESYPLLSRFNYVIAGATIDNTLLFLDASQPLLGFGKLPLNAFNGYARMVAKEPMVLNFTTDLIVEKKVTTVFIGSDEKGILEGNFKTKPGYYESMDIRKKLKDKGEADYFKQISSAYGSDMEISKPSFDSLKNTESPLTVNYDFKINNTGEDIIYFNPMMLEGYKTNIFKAAERTYPVEMPYTFDETYLLTMDIPATYNLEELPKSAKVSFNDGEGYFEYIVGKSDNTIQLKSRVIIKKANFLPEEYNSLRDFFGYIIKKQSEQVVLKKKK